MVERSSPTTSERTRVTTRAGAAARARPPPLRRERCLRTVLSSVMPAPARMSRAVTADLSSRLRPGTGAGSSAEAPPESSTRTMSSAVRPRTMASAACAACTPRASGSGWPARSSRVRRRGGPGALDTARPSASRAPRTCSAAAAIAGAALPAARTSTRPRPSGYACPAAIKRRPCRRRAARTSGPGSAACKPAASTAAAARRSAARLEGGRGCGAERPRRGRPGFSVPCAGPARSAG